MSAWELLRGLKRNVFLGRKPQRKRRLFESRIGQIELLEDRTLLSAPAANDDSFFTPVNTALDESAPGLLVNDTDAENDPLTAVLDSGPSDGTLQFNADGSFLYTPNAGFVGVDSFSYRADDGSQTGNPATVVIDVGDIAGDTQGMLLPASIHRRTLYSRP